MQHWIDEAILLEPCAITGDVLSRMVPGCSEPETWANALGTRLVMAGIESNHTIAMFTAHAGHESGSFHSLEESLNYGVEALDKLFGSHRITQAQIQAYGRKPGQQADESTLGNLLYGGDWGARNLGNVEFGDGYRYRGRGIFQLTGRANYEQCSVATGLDLVGDPDLLVRDPDAAVTAALWFWSAYVTGQDMKRTTAQINGGYHGLADRIDRYKRALRVLEGVA